MRNNVFCEIFYSKFSLLRIFLFCNFGVRKKNCKFFAIFFSAMNVNTKFENVSFLKTSIFSIFFSKINRISTEFFFKYTKIAKIIFLIFFQFFFSKNFFYDNFFYKFFLSIFFGENFSFHKNICAKIFLTIFSRIAFVFDVCEIMYFAKNFIRNFAYCENWKLFSSFFSNFFFFKN